jgi:hypothetical protein
MADADSAPKSVFDGILRLRRRGPKPGGEEGSDEQTKNGAAG